MVRRAWFGFLLLPLLLTGCLEVEMQVGSRGKVTQTFTATVSRRAADVLEAAAENYLGRNWRVLIERKGEMNTVRIWRSYDARQVAKPMPGLTVQFRRLNHWFRATYELQLRYNPSELLQTKDEQALATDRKVNVRITMPGRILPEQSSVPVADHRTAEISIDPLKPANLRLVSVGFLWVRIGGLLLLLAILLWLVAPYFPRIAARFQQRTVRVVQE